MCCQVNMILVIINSVVISMPDVLSLHGKVLLAGELQGWLL